MTQTSSQDISKLDRNFALGTVEGDVRWIDAHDLAVEGMGWPGESQPFTRLPDRAQPLVREPVWNLSRHSAGVRVRFMTDASTLFARWHLRNPNLAMNHMPATGVSGLDLYTHTHLGWRWTSVAIPSKFPENDGVLAKDLDPVTPGGNRLCMVYLPLYNGLERLQFGIRPDAKISPAPRVNGHDRPIVFYGTSITQGGCASRAGMGYPEIVSRWLDVPHINLGFSGNGKMEPEMAQLLAELDPRVFVLDPLPNNPPPDVAARLGPLVRTIRAARPNTPIVLVESVNFQNAHAVAEKRNVVREKNLVAWNIYGQLKAEGLTNLHHVPGANLLGDDGEGTVDGIHPTDVGFLRIAQTLKNVLKSLV